jgi:hypothetical protein
VSFDVLGAWTRQSVSIGEAEAFETQLVIWLQAETCYADLRVPLNPASEERAGERCFSGFSGWDGDLYRWTHRLDLETGSPAADDAGRLVREGEAIVERGMFPTFDGALPYQEIWVPIPGAGRPFLGLERPNGSFLRVGDHAITIADQRGSGGTFSAAYYRQEGDQRWSVVASIGDVTDLAGPDQLADTLLGSDPLPSGWVLVEQG